NRFTSSGTSAKFVHILTGTFKFGSSFDLFSGGTANHSGEKSFLTFYLEVSYIANRSDILHKSFLSCHFAKNLRVNKYFAAAFTKFTLYLFIDNTQGVVIQCNRVLSHRKHTFREDNTAIGMK